MMLWMNRRFALPEIVPFAAFFLPLLSLVSSPLPTLRGQTNEDSLVDPQRFQVRVIAERCIDPMQLAMLDEQSALLIERRGRVVRLDLERGGKVEVGQIPVAVFGEVGLMGVAVDPRFAENSWIYFCYCPASKSNTIRVSRFTLRGNEVELSSEKVLLEYAIDVAGAIHMGGGLEFDSQGNLLLGTGDNCPPIPELPVDTRPGRENFDALRTSANTQDLRGKVLRIRPLEDGTYEIPAGNLFANPAEGRPEIYAMGCRNPFGISVDLATDAVYWGDVGPNIDLSLGVGPNGYDEFNRAERAGNFGWPMFVGPNEAYRDFDFETRKALDLFDVSAPRNLSRNNTGQVDLPPPQSALIWYPSTNSPEFPWVGSGGRSAMTGPIYHAAAFDACPTRMPDAWDGRLFAFDWTRNWIYAVAIGEQGKVQQADRLLPEFAFRKPIDVVLGKRGELYVVEFGNLWGENQDGRVFRVDYVRGNRAPLVKLKLDPAAGRHPLVVTADAGETRDPDGDESIHYEWTVDGEPLSESGSRISLTFETPGEHRVIVRASDAQGAASTATSFVRVGNSPPQVQFLRPRPGAIVDPETTLPYELEVVDIEEGSTRARTIASSRVLLESRFSRRLARDADPLAEDSDPGLIAMRATTCFSCHTAKTASAGPAYRDVALRYAADPAAREKLAMKVLQGGAGAWGEKPMPPHPQHSMDEVLPMIDWIMSLVSDSSQVPQIGQSGYFRPEIVAPNEGGVWTLIGSFTDQGTPEAAALRGEARVRLHSRRKRAPYFDRSSAVQWVDVYEHGIGMAGRFAERGWISCDQIDLGTIDRIRVRVAAAGDRPVKLELRLDAPDGERIGEAWVEPRRDALGDLFSNVVIPITPTTGLRDLFVVASKPSETDGKQGPVASEAQGDASNAETWCLGLSWMEFLESPAAREEREQEAANRKQILLVATAHDHPPATHMYREVCNILAACLNQHPGVEAIVAREDDFPTDPELLDRIDAVVFYSRPAGDIVLSPAHREAFEKMLKRGVGFTAIHWATGAETQVGAQYEKVLGGWFNFEFSGIKVDRRPLVQVQAEHEICRGWNGYDLRDEFYLNLKFAPQAQPVLTVDVDGVTQCVAWVLNRDDGGRSFGTTLGHFHDNYAIPEFRRMLVNGILWTAGVEVPESGSLVDVTPEQLALAPVKPAVSHAWTTDELQQSLESLAGSPSFERGARLFESASCAACHRLGKVGNALGPDLDGVRVRMAAQRNPQRSLLREVVEPSAVIADAYRTSVIRLDSGETLAGLVVQESDEELVLATDPTRPNHRETVPQKLIEERVVSELSLMPTGLLDRLSPAEIRDLLTFVEAEGDPEYVAYQSGQRSVESWGDPSLPIREGLSWWLDTRTLNAGRVARGLPEVQDQGLIDRWPDASGFGRDVVQRVQAAQPRLDLSRPLPVVVLDGEDDWLGASQVNLRTRDATILVVVAPTNNHNWPGIVSGNARTRNDYQTGFNIDLMPEATEQWQTIMVEGPGFIGVQNLMRESHPFERFQVVTVRTTPGSDTVQLRFNGRVQGARGREEGELVIDELAVGARYWSNDAGIPPYNRGFLKGSFAGILFFERALSDQELAGLESYLWKYYEPLLEVKP